ncbi:MAG: ATP-binding protein [Thermodesulfobacteriota bacterium]
MKTVRKIIKIDEKLCDGCGQCVPACAEGAIQIIDGKAKVISDNLCDGLGACLGQCPTGALQIIEREAEEFDEEAVEEHLKTMESRAETSPEKSIAASACGCPSQQIQTFHRQPTPRTETAQSGTGTSALTHWPIQIRLVPANAPFLKGADLLVIADCVAVAYPNLHGELLNGRAVMMGCPKFDDVDGYVEKFTDVFANAGLKSVTIVSMEVPCCSSLPGIVEKAMAAAGKTVPLKELVISSTGEVISESKWSDPAQTATA